MTFQERVHGTPQVRILGTRRFDIGVSFLRAADFDGLKENLIGGRIPVGHDVTLGTKPIRDVFVSRTR